MTTYREFQAELAKLHQQAEAARRIEKAAALDRIRALIIEYRLLPKDLGLGPVSSKRRASAAPVMYRDPATGATWTGRGRAPGWIAGQDRASFAVNTA